MSNHAPRPPPIAEPKPHDSTARFQPGSRTSGPAPASVPRARRPSGTPLAPLRACTRRLASRTMSSNNGTKQMLPLVVDVVEDSWVRESNSRDSAPAAEKHGSSRLSRQLGECRNQVVSLQRQLEAQKRHQKDFVEVRIDTVPDRDRRFGLWGDANHLRQEQLTELAALRAENAYLKGIRVRDTAVTMHSQEETGHLATALPAAQNKSDALTTELLSLRDQLDQARLSVSGLKQQNSKLATELTKANSSLAQARQLAAQDTKFAQQLADQENLMLQLEHQRDSYSSVISALSSEIREA
eukprot:gene626-2484_t